MVTRPLPTAARLRELLAYDPATGAFTWRVRRGYVRAGDVAGTPHGVGYSRIKIDQGCYLTHRLAWLYVYGLWPIGQIDHINGDRADNRIMNLREATPADNRQNLHRAHANNKSSGLLGASRSGKTWQAQISANGKRRHIGSFPTAELAHAAYVAAKRELHSSNTL